ncbi:MAG TPA: pyridoxal-dependent decarboxylase [Gemmatimonadaceae bacterium]|nr:pyridoxal-dependent decarboxylase [Gemmatimonadaceae bacterium]
MSSDILNELAIDSRRDAGSLFTDLVCRYLEETRAEVGPVSTPLSVEEIARRFDEPLPREGRPLREVVDRIGRDVVRDANHLTHPMYMGHQVSAPLPAAIWAEPAISMLNNSLAVREMSPTLTAIEHRVVRWMTDLAGLGPRAGGTLTTGGTEATFTALLAARSRTLPAAWADGVGANPPVVLHGEHAHYSVTRAIAQLGLGTRCAIAIPSRDLRMDAEALKGRLEQLASAGTRVMAVVATAGSTATGTFDELETIGRVCAERGVWLHIDGAHGASALLSRAHRARMRGLEHASSVAWDPHKMMLLPLSAGLLLVRDERDLDAAFAQQAPYLFHGDEEERAADQGVRSFMCSRRADALKVWVALQRYGADGIGALYDRLCGVTRRLYDAIADRIDFEALHEPESNILCFRWIGSAGRDDSSLDEMNRELRERYNRAGHGWITSTVLGGRRVLRVTMMNPLTHDKHVTRLLDGLAHEAQSLP